LTRRCNYRCRGCTVWREQRSAKSEISTDQIKRGLDVLRSLGVVEIVLSGGNPLLRNDIDEIIEYCSRYFLTTIYDNGSMAVKKIDALKNADFVSISLDSLDEKKFDYIRGVQGAWQNAVNAVETLKDEGINIGVSPMISQMNLYEVVDFTKYFTDRHVPVWYCVYSYDSPLDSAMFGIGKKQDEFEITDRKTMATVCDTLMEMKKEREGVYITNKTLTALKELFLHNHRIWKCGALSTFLMVDSLGRVAGCHRNEPVGSIYELPEIWNSPRLDELRLKYSRCNKCTYLCYIFYSLYGDVLSNLSLARDQWKNARSMLHKPWGQRQT
jgi:MoaA/NifB/PqqE/SkfB family radical SAM enzyme